MGVNATQFRNDAMSDIRMHRLADGRRVFYRSQAGLEVLLHEFFERAVYEHCGMNLQNGDCIFDVGANIGFFLLDLNRRLRWGTVFCFEPIPETFELLKRNAEENNHLGLRLFPCGLASKPGEVQFTHHPLVSLTSTMSAYDSTLPADLRRMVYTGMRLHNRLFRCLARLTPMEMWLPLIEVVRRIYFRRTFMKCRVRPLSAVVDEYSIKKIDLLKIDVEGAERDVFDGIRQEHWSLIRQVIVETHFGTAQADEIVARLRKHGFKVECERLDPAADAVHVLFACKASSGVRPRG